MLILSWVDVLFQNYFCSGKIRVEVGFSPVQDVSNRVSVEEACFTVCYVSFCDGKNPLGFSLFHCDRLLSGLVKVMSMEFAVPAVPDCDVIVPCLFNCFPHP